MVTKIVHIEQTETEYILLLPYDGRQRAKSIEGYRWDPERKRWVYPRTRRVYDALIAEFGDDLVELKISRPQLTTSSEQRAALQNENQSLKEELEGIRSALQVISQSNQDGKTSELRTLQTALASREDELASLRGQLQDREKGIQALMRQLSELRAESERFRETVSNVQVEASKRTVTSTATVPNVEQLMRQKAKEATGNDPVFVGMLDRLRLDSSFPIELGKCLDRKLRELLRCEDRSLSLHDLITQAKDADVLPEEAIDMAHTIRKQRNIMAHDRLDTRTHGGRVLFVLFAASILWPQLPDGNT